MPVYTGKYGKQGQWYVNEHLGTLEISRPSFTGYHVASSVVKFPAVKV